MIHLNLQLFAKPKQNASANAKTPKSDKAIVNYEADAPKKDAPKAEAPKTEAPKATEVGAETPYDAGKMPAYTEPALTTPSFTPVQTPTYTAPTTSAQKATSITSRLDKNTLDTMKSKFQVSQSYQQAMDYTNKLLEQLSGGKTTYTDQISQLIKDYQNREDFSYDASEDALFQQMLSSSMASGKTAMADTMGQAAALTGGYGSTYSQAVGNNVYNQYIQEAYNNLPEYYQLAFDAYNQEGQNMLNELAMLNDADSKEYDRLYNAYSANFNNAQNMYNQEFNQWQSNVNNAYNYADLMNSDYWSKLNYDEGIRQYEQDFGYRQYQDALNQTNYENDFNYRQYQDAVDRNNFEREFAYKQYTDEYNKWWDKNEANREQGNWQSSFDYNKEQDEQTQQNWKDEFDREDERFIALNDLNGDGKVDSKDHAYGITYTVDENGDEVPKYDSLSTSEYDKVKSVFLENGGGEAGYNAVANFLKSIGKNVNPETIESVLSGTSPSKEDMDSLSTTEWNKVEELYLSTGGGDAGLDAVAQYLEALGKTNFSDEWNKNLKNRLLGLEVPLKYQNWELTNDTYNGGFLGLPVFRGEDKNDEYSYKGETLTYKELKKRIMDDSSLTKEEKEQLLSKLQTQSKK